MKLQKQDKNGWLHFYILTIYSCIFVIPTTHFQVGSVIADIPRFVFLAASLFLLTIFLFSEKIAFVDLFLLLIIVLVGLISKSLRVLTWIGSIVMYRLIKMGYGWRIKSIVETTNMNYVASLFTIFYTVVWGVPQVFVGDLRIAKTAVMGVNESGLAILCLGFILRKNNKMLGNLMLALGMLTISRNYLISFALILFLSSERRSRKYYSLFNKNVLSFFPLMIITAIILLFIGVLFQYWQSRALISHDASLVRMLNFRDESNHRRFSVNLALIMAFIENPRYLFYGLPYEHEAYLHVLELTSSKNNINFTVQISPHNFLFSYLRIYGIFTLALVIHIHKIMKEIITKYNIGIYLGICVYAVFMSAGFSVYWLNLTCFTLLSYIDTYPMMFDERIKRRSNYCKKFSQKRRMK